MGIVAPFFVGTFSPFSSCVLFPNMNQHLAFEMLSRHKYVVTHIQLAYDLCFSLFHPVYYYQFQSNLSNLNPCAYTFSFNGLTISLVNGMVQSNCAIW